MKLFEKTNTNLKFKRKRKIRLIFLLLLLLLLLCESYFRLKTEKKEEKTNTFMLQTLFLAWLICFFFRFNR